MNLTLTAACLLLFTLGSCAQQERPGRWTKNGEPDVNAADHKAINGFGAHLIVVKNPHAFVDVWRRPEKPEFDTVKEIGFNEEVGVMILFAGCTPDARGFCDCEVDYLLEKPDGSVLVDKKSQNLWSMAAPPESNTELGSAVLAFNTATSLHPGAYKVKATVRDKHADVTFDLETQFVLKK
jgi:hypothetical protein